MVEGSVMTSLADRDPAVAQAIEGENRRQRESIVLIASENYASRAVLEAQANLMNNKYAEGYPGRRYYGGCQYVDQVEQLAIDRAKSLFGAEHANVQPHCGTQANMAVYFSVLQPGDTLMGMDLPHGGHLSHGHRLSFSGRLYNIVTYGVDVGLKDMSGKDAEAWLNAARIRGQQEHHPVRRPLPVRHLGSTYWHPLGNVTRSDRRAHGDGRRLDRTRVRIAGRREHLGGYRLSGARPLERLPDLRVATIIRAAASMR